MTKSLNLPSKIAAQDVVASTEQTCSLVARGLAAVYGLKKQQLLSAANAVGNAEQLFKQGMLYRYGEEGMPEDDDKAHEYLLAAAKLNHAEAQFELAYLFGEVGTQNEADQWFERSAHLGFGPALRYLVWYSDLTKDKRDELFIKAYEWYENRAISGDAKSQFEFAEMLLKGDVRHTHIEKGYHWLKASAAQDYRSACRRLGEEYLNVKATEDAATQGIYWLTRAADLEDILACRTLGNLYLLGHARGLSAKNLGRDQSCRIEPDKKEAIVWYTRSIMLGDRSTACDLGLIYLDGEHLDKDIVLAEKWLLHSAKEGYNPAQIVLSNEYASGVRLRKDTDAAISWLTVAAERSRSAALKLAETYLDDKIIPKNFEEAIKLLTRTADDAFFRNKAMKIVAEKCFEGRSSAAEKSAAQVWLEQMAVVAQESVVDMNEFNVYYLAELYELGLGTEHDMDKAVYWYMKSAQQGNLRAQTRLHELCIDWKIS